MSVRTAGDVTVHETVRGDFAIAVGDVDIAYADTQFEAESFKTFVSGFAVSYTAVTSVWAYVKEVQQARKIRELGRPIDVDSEILEGDTHALGDTSQ